MSSAGGAETGCVGGGGGGGVALMSCMREASLEPPSEPPPDKDSNATPTNHRNETKKGRFFRGLRRMFRRRSAAGTPAPVTRAPDDTLEQPDHIKSRSTGELMADQRTRRKSGQTVYTTGLSVSHDSVFTGEHSASAGSGSGESADESGAASSATHRTHDGSKGNQYMTSGVRAELLDAVRRRGRAGGVDGSDDDEDLGLPQSPPASPSIDKGTKRHHAAKSQSSCSDNSLLSVGSSEMEEDSSGQTNSNDGLTPSSDVIDGANEEPPSGIAPLSHSAARHKMAVKPRRTHGVPRRKKNAQVSLSSALPTTPEVNEDGTRNSISETVTVTDSYISEKVTTTSTRLKTKHVQYDIMESPPDGDIMRSVPIETKLKSSSLPPGLALSHVMGQAPLKLSLSEQKDSPQSSIKRSRSSAQNKNIKIGEENNSTQSVSEKNLAKCNTEWNDIGGKHMNNILRGLDMRLSSAVTSEIQNKFLSVSEQEDVLHSGYIESDSRLIKGEKKSDNDNKYKKIESEVHTEKKESSKKEESFFSRLLLRKSGKKAKKEMTEFEQIQTEKKNQSRNSTPQHYKQLKSELNPPLTPPINYTDHAYIRHQKMTCSEQSSHKTIGHRVFSNQVHKRIDKKGGYVNDSLIQEANYAKGSVTDYGVNDLKHFAEIEKVSSEVQQASSENRRSSNENVHRFGPVPYQRMRQRIEPMDITSEIETPPKPQLPAKTLESKLMFPAIPHQAKIQATGSRENICSNGASTVQLKNSSEDFTTIPALPIKQRSNHDLVYQINNVAIPRPIPEDFNDKSLSFSVSPPKSVWPQKYESNLRSNSQSSLSASVPLQFNLKLDLNSAYERPGIRQPDVVIAKPKIAGLSSYQQRISQMECELESNDFPSFTDLAEFRNPVSKSQSFRFMSDAVSMNSHQENQMPSLPTMFGYSDSSMESWETNYKRQLREESEKLVERNLESRRKSASNVFSSPENDIKSTNITNVSKENDFPLKEIKHRPSLYNKNIVIGGRLEGKLCDADISQIEANIDSIIGSPKPLITSSLKSCSLDSVKSQSNKRTDRNRKALSSESILNNTSHVGNSHPHNILPSVTFTPKNISQKRLSENNIPDNFIIVNQKSREDIHFEIPDKNNEKIYENVSDFNVTKTRYVKSPSKTSDGTSKSGVPEFMKIQLNKVDSKPTSNIVLSTSQNISPNDEKANTPKKNPETNNTTPKSVKKYKDSMSDIKSATIDRSFSHDRRDYEDYKPHRKFSAEDVEIIEKSNNVTSSQAVHISKSSSQQRLNKSTEYLTYDSDNTNSFRTSFDMKYSNNVLNQNNKNLNLPPVSPTSYKPFYKKRQNSMEIIDDTNRRNSGTAIYENVTFDDNGPKQSKDVVELSPKIMEEVNGDGGVVYRKKPVVGNPTKSKKDDEPELMKVFARRSLKLKDSETETLAQDILDCTDAALSNDSVVRNKNNKSDFNAMIRSRDSDKENESNSPKDNRKSLLDIENKSRNSVDNKKVEQNDLTQNQRNIKKSADLEVQSPKKFTNNQNLFSRNNAFSGYQRSVSISSVSSALVQSNNAKNDSKNDTAMYKKEVSDSTPEKRLRNRTFPDSSNEGAREDLKVINATNDVLKFKSDSSSLPKRSWNVNKQEDLTAKKIPYRNLSFVTENKNSPVKVPEVKQANSVESPNLLKENSQPIENNSSESVNLEGEADGSPQFKGILQMRAEWERRAKQAMTK